MARNYNNRYASRSKSDGLQKIFICALAFLFGYLAASFVPLNQLAHWVNSQRSSEAQVKPTAAHPPTQLPTKPKFEFYTLLAHEKAPASASVPARAPTPPPTRPPAAAKDSASAPVVSAAASVPTTKHVALKSADKRRYVIQVASFKSRLDAEQLKGLLILKGFDVRVEAVAQAQGNWFRVLVGPYPDRGLAQKAQVTLAKTERLNGMMRVH